MGARRCPICDRPRSGPYVCKDCDGLRLKVERGDITVAAGLIWAARIARLAERARCRERLATLGKPG